MSTATARTLAQLPRFSAIDHATLVTRLTALLDAHRTRLSIIAETTEPARWDNVAEPMEVMADELQRLFGPVSHLHHVADDAKTREVYNTCIGLVSAYGSEIAQHAGLCARYQALRESAEYAGYDAARRRVVDNALRDFRLGGVDLPPGMQAEVKTLKVELAQLGTRFEEQVLDATQAYELPVPDEARLAGLPDSVRALAREKAARAGRTGALLTLDLPCYVPAMSHLADRALRAELYQAYVTRASECGPHAGRYDNGPLLHDILARRQRLARCLGFANYAELSLATKMAPSTGAVLGFLRELAAKARPAAEREYAELAAYASQELGIAELAAWDLAYATEQLRRTRYALSQEDLKPYFPIGRVLDGLFAIVGRLFGLSFSVQDGVETWHEDVRFHAVSDADGTPLGYFYLDLYARERKRSGAWMDECLVRWRHAGVTRLPVAYLTCNFTPPLPGRPTLLTHDEVITLFHEFGHGLHHLLTTVERPAVAGINGVPWDAVELPSQFLENWCWEREALDLMSGHHESGAPLPEELFARLARSRHFNAALAMLRQIEFALFDFRLHCEYVPGCDIQALLDSVRAEIAIVKPPAWNRFQHGFSHVFAGGYAAGYYSYKWAEVLAADAFARFEEEGIFNAAVGRDFRSLILANGGAEDALALFERFRGRPPAVEPLLRQAGLAA